MAKICPKCRQQQFDQRLIACDKCKVPFIDEAEVLTSFTRDELKIIAGFLLKDWRVYIIAGVFLAIAAGMLFWQAREYVKAGIAEFRSSVSNQVTTAYGNATNQLSSQFQVFATKASNKLTDTYFSVTNQIVAQFRTSRIKETIQNVAQSEAKSILQHQVKPTVERFQEDAFFIRTVARTHGYDFKAYQILMKMARGTNDNAQLARQVTAEMDRALLRDRSEFTPQKIYIEVYKTNFYRGPFTTDELAERFSAVANDQTSANREGFVNVVAETKQRLFMSDLVGMLTNETDLAVADRLTIAISNLAGEDFHPKDYEQITDWWKTHSTAYPHWPLEALAGGFDEFAAARYSNSVAKFEQILKLDPAADRTRAYAIACYWELGETNRAVALAEQFANKTSRWSQWASAKAELESGAISNATVHFFCIHSNFPTMAKFDRVSDVYRKVDWEFWDSLAKTEKVNK